MKGIISLIAIVGIVLVLGGGVILIKFIPLFSPGANFFYIGCEGNIESTNVTSAFKGEEFLSIGRCSIYDNTDQERCEEAYSTLFNNSKPFCIWVEDIEQDINNNGYNDTCVLNPAVSCEVLTENTNPGCSDVPRCQKINIIKRMLSNII